MDWASTKWMVITFIIPDQYGNTLIEIYSYSLMVCTCNKQTSFEVCSNSDKSYWAIGPDLSDSNSIIRTEERGLSFIPVVGWRYDDGSNWISNDNLNLTSMYIKVQIN